MKIGITVDIGKSSIWANGITQNGIYLAILFKKLGYECDILTENITQRTLDEFELISDGFDIKIVNIMDSFNIGYDVLISLGILIPESMYNSIKKINNNLKYVSYRCGNDFLYDLETILFNAHGRAEMTNEESIHPDQIWLIPQQEKSNLSYSKFLAGQDNATVVPFVWEPNAIENSSKSIGLNPVLNRNIKNISIMEPNLSVHKNALLPIIIADNFYKRGHDINKVYILSGMELNKSKRFLNIISRASLYKSGKLTAESRYATPFILKEHAELILSWQFENNLNYLYLDVAWMGYPIVHNGSLCKDIGYYYDEYNAEIGTDVLEYAYKNHINDTNYLDRNRKLIKRYTTQNKKLLEQYKMLIENLVNDKFVKYEYVWKTNSIK